jgi:AraC-like DNA-binding protein
MRYDVRRPSAALAPFVESIWSFAGELAHARERILPHGRMQLLVNLHEDELRSYHGDGFTRLDRIRGAALSGPFSGHFAIDTAEQRHILGVSFRPGGAYPFFRVPADALREQHVELDDLWPGGGRSLRARLGEAAGKGAPAALAALEAALVERIVRPLERDGAVDFALAAFEDDVPVTTVGERLGLSARSFIQRFTTRIGLTPKRYARIQRFQRVIAALDRGEPVSWAGIAASCGYFDQAHLIHDFRAFAGIRPGDYVAGGTGGRNHVRIDD